MTRKSKRELQRTVDDLEDDDGRTDTFDVVYRDDRTGEFVDQYGEPTESDPDVDMIVIITNSLVMDRDRAERQSREILGPAEDAPDDRDVVRVTDSRTRSAPYSCR